MVQGWEFFLNRINANITDQCMKKQLTKAVQTMRQHLGEDWPSEAESDNLLRWSLESVSGTDSDYLLVLWGDAIAATEGSVGFRRMVAKLRMPGRLESCIAELEVAGRLACNGCCVQFEPKVDGKRPDLLCRYDGYEFLVEVKMLETAPQIHKSIKNTMAITTACRPIFPVGRILRILSGQDLEEAAGVMRQAADQAISGNIPQEVCNQDMKMYLVPDSLPDRAKVIKKWLDEQNGSVVVGGGGGMYGPPYRAREERRVGDRINKIAKERQIPPDRVGVLVVQGSFHFGNADTAKRPVAYIAKALCRIRNVPAVVLVSNKIFGGYEASAVTERQGFTFIRNRLHVIIHEEVIIIWNPHYESEFDHELLKRLLTTDCGSAA